MVFKINRLQVTKKTINIRKNSQQKRRLTRFVYMLKDMLTR